MPTQKCPKCKSSRIRRGYRPTPFLRKLLLRRNLLCNDCNWQFIGFAFGKINGNQRRKNINEVSNENES